LWCADVPLLLDGERAGALRLWMDREPRRSLLRALRGLGHEAAAQLGQERERLRALRDLTAARQHQAALAAAAARLRRETEMPDVTRVVGEELRKLGFESALLLSEARGLVIAQLSLRGPAASKALELLGFKRMSELRALPVDPARSPMLGSLVSSPEPVIEVQPGPLLRALLGRRAPRAVLALGDHPRLHRSPAGRQAGPHLGPAAAMLADRAQLGAALARLHRGAARLLALRADARHDDAAPVLHQGSGRAGGRRIRAAVPGAAHQRAAAGRARLAARAGRPRPRAASARQPDRECRAPPARRRPHRRFRRAQAWLPACLGPGQR